MNNIFVGVVLAFAVVTVGLDSVYRNIYNISTYIALSVALPVIVYVGSDRYLAFLLWGDFFLCLIFSMNRKAEVSASSLFNFIILDLLCHVSAICFEKVKERNAVSKLDLESALENTNFLASHDKLSGLLARQTLDGVAKKVMDECIYRKKPVYAVMLDIDFFKSVNDTYGHPIGDKAITFIGETIKKNIPEDLGYAFRYGGEEFLIVLYKCPKEDAYKTVSNIHSEVKRLSPEILKIPLTISCGLYGKVPAEDEMIYSYVKSADDCLYKAKNTGRDKIVFEVSD